MASTEDGEPPEDLRNRRVSAKALHRLRKHLVESDIEERLATPGMDPRRADLSVAGSVLFDTIIRRLGTNEFTLCDLALREGIVLDYIHKQQRPHPQGRALPRRPAPQHRRAWRAVRVLVGACTTGREAGAEHLRSDARRARAVGPGAGVARVRCAPPRHRRPHQLRASPPPFVLLDQERRPPRVRPAGNRGHRAHRALPSPGDPEEIARGLRRSEGAAAQDRQDPLGHGAARRRPRSQPRAGARGHRPVSAQRRLHRAPARHGRRRARALGRQPPRRAPRAIARQTGPLRGRRQRTTRTRGRRHTDHSVTERQC